VVEEECICRFRQSFQVLKIAIVKAPTEIAAAFQQVSGDNTPGLVAHVDAARLDRSQQLGRAAASIQTAGKQFGTRNTVLVHVMGVPF